MWGTLLDHTTKVPMRKTFQQNRWHVGRTESLKSLKVILSGRNPTPTLTVIWPTIVYKTQIKNTIIMIKEEFRKRFCKWNLVFYRRIISSSRVLYFSFWYWISVTDTGQKFYTWSWESRTEGGWNYVKGRYDTIRVHIQKNQLDKYNSVVNRVIVFLFYLLVSIGWVSLSNKTNSTSFLF